MSSQLTAQLGATAAPLSPPSQTEPEFLNSENHRPVCIGYIVLHWMAIRTRIPEQRESSACLHWLHRSPLDGYRTRMKAVSCDTPTQSSDVITHPAHMSISTIPLSTLATER